MKAVIRRTYAPPTIVRGNHQPKGLRVTKVPPTSVNVDPRLDDAILESANGEWCKVAVLIARATDAARTKELTATPHDIANRIYAMTADNRLEVSGNVRRWRAAEVRKKDGATS